MIIKFFKRLDIRLIGIFIVIVFLWNTQFVYPLKIFVVFMHEVSHGLAALATGGSIKEIQVVPQEGGHAITAGGSRFWTLTAGYLGEPNVGRTDSDSCGTDTPRQTDQCCYRYRDDPYFGLLSTKQFRFSFRRWVRRGTDHRR